MIDISPDQARTLAAIVAHGSFDAAAAHLSVTPSAVSQRIRALEAAVGRPVLTTGAADGTHGIRPGRGAVRPAARVAFGGPRRGTAARGNPRRTRLTLVINSDSLHTWALAGLSAVAGTVQLEILREDQDYSLELLRSGAAAAAITATAKPAAGCTSRRLGVMRYLPVCTPAFAAAVVRRRRAAAESLAKAPVIIFDRKDDLQDRYLRRFSRKPLEPPRHYVPAAHEFGEAIRLGMGWGMMPEIEIGQDLEQRTLADPGRRSPSWTSPCTGSSGATVRPRWTASRRPSRTLPAC